MIVMIDPVPFAVALAKGPAPDVSAFPLASAALMAVLIELNLSPLPDTIVTPDDWAKHHAARNTWIKQNLLAVSVSNPYGINAPVCAAVVLESWIAQLPAIHLAQFVESMADALRTDGDQLEDIEAPAHVCEVLTLAFLQGVAYAWDEYELIELKPAFNRPA